MYKYSWHDDSANDNSSNADWATAFLLSGKITKLAKLKKAKFLQKKIGQFLNHFYRFGCKLVRKKTKN